MKISRREMLKIGAGAGAGSAGCGARVADGSRASSSAWSASSSRAAGSSSSPGTTPSVSVTGPEVGGEASADDKLVATFQQYDLDGDGFLNTECVPLPLPSRLGF